MPRFVCTVCLVEKEGKNKILRRNKPMWEYHLSRRLPESPPLEEDGKICSACFQRAYNHANPRRKENPVPDPIPAEGEMLVRTVGRTRSFCCICGLNERPMQEVTKLISAYTWVAVETYVPPKNRICRLHVHNGRLSSDSLDELATRASLRVMTEKELLEHMQVLLRSVVQHVPEEPKSTMDFDNADLTDAEYMCYTGLSRRDFEDLLPFLGDRIHESCNRSKRNALAIFLCKLRMNNSQDALGHMFGMDQPRISEVFHQVTEALYANFKPLYLGYDHMSREEFIRDHSRTLASILFDQQPESCMFIMDGTYLEVEKSSNFKLQRDTFSGQKHYNLVKPLFVTGTDGYIWAAEGLFPGTNNDAGILNHMMDADSPFANLVQEDDILILDRGFRDNKAKLEDAGVRMIMPNLLTGGRTQFDDLEANESRLVTMVRWVIEAVNGRLKNKFKFFRDRISNCYLEDGFLMKLVEIACALINKYSPPIAPDKDGDLERARVIKDRAGISNLLLELLQDRGWLNTKRVNFVPAELQLQEDFPRLTLDVLEDISMGVYQIRMARSYTAQHIKDGEYQFKMHRAEPGLICVKMNSRFRSDKVHTSWIHYFPNGEGVGSIRGYYCCCQTGARTLGCCSHIMSTLWYLGIGRYAENLKFPAENLGANLFDVRTRAR